jgi:hypothetical protein
MTQQLIIKILGQDWIGWVYNSVSNNNVELREKWTAGIQRRLEYSVRNNNITDILAYIV